MHPFCCIVEYMTKLVYILEVKSMTIRNIPEETLQRFKAWAALQGQTLNDAIIMTMEEKGSEVAIRPKKTIHHTRKKPSE